jgi:hypothetical protein
MRELLSFGVGLELLFEFEFEFEDEFARLRRNAALPLVYS